MSQKSICQIMLNKVLKVYERWATVKANKNNKKWIIWWLYLTNFHYLIWFELYPFWCCWLRIGREREGMAGGGFESKRFLLIGQNLLSLIGVICWQSLRRLGPKCESRLGQTRQKDCFHTSRLTTNTIFHKNKGLNIHNLFLN